MRAIGVDLHKNMFEVCYLSDSETRFSRYSIVELEKFCKSLDKGDKLAVEATGNTRYFFNQVSPHVLKTVVVNPHQFKVISESTKKTDRADAEKLAFYLSKDILPEVRMLDELSSQVKSLTHTRDKLVKLRTSLNHCRVKQHLNASIKRLDGEIEEHGKRLKGYGNITSIKGIGSKSAAILLRRHR